MPSGAGPKLLREWIDRAALRDPVKPWLIRAEDGRAVSYGELRDATARIAGVLKARNLGDIPVGVGAAAVRTR